MGFLEGLNKLGQHLADMKERQEQSKAREQQRIERSQARYSSWSDDRLKNEYRSLNDKRDEMFFPKEDYIAVKRELRSRGFNV